MVEFEFCFYHLEGNNDVTSIFGQQNHLILETKPVLLNLFDPLHPFKKQFSAIHPHHDKSSYYRKLKLGDNDIGCIL